MQCLNFGRFIASIESLNRSINSFLFRYVEENKLSQSSLVRRKINREMTKIQLMDNNVVANHEVLQESTTNPETLQVFSN